MQLTMVGSEATHNIEEHLWSRVLVAELDAQRISLQCEKAWRLHVMCGDMETGSMWDALSAKWKEARDHVDALRREWKRVAYPLYGWPCPDDDKK